MHRLAWNRWSRANASPHPLAWAAAASLLMAVVGARAGSTEPRSSGSRTDPDGRVDVASEARDPATLGDATLRQAKRAHALGLVAVCPSGTVPDGEVCVRLPDPDLGGDPFVVGQGAHFDKKGTYQVYDQIPRRPDWPADYSVYRYPIAVRGPVGSGYDLDLPDADQRRGRHLSHVGHGGIDLSAPRGAEIRRVRSDHQEGDSEVVYVGRLFGTTVVTRDTLRETGVLREYLVLYGHLESVAPGLAPGQMIPEDGLVGYVGDSGSEGIVHLHLEFRQVREGIDLTKVPPAKLVANEVSIVCDPRNILAVR